MDDFRSKLKYTQNENVFEVEEILTSILLRLPVKSLLICKSVCKYWRALICSRSFMHLHLIHSQQNPSYVFYSRYAFRDSKRDDHIRMLIKTDGETTQSFPSCDEFCFKGMICSFNGLICGIHHSTRTTVGINIYNPATREVLFLPQTPRSECTLKLGVSFSPTVNGYKLFQFFYRKNQLYECMIYSSITGSWKSIGRVAHSPHPCSKHVCIDGMVYWFSNSRIGGRLVDHILAVDREENFSIIRIPEEETTHPFLVNLEGCLCLVVVAVAVAENGLDQMRFDIWALQNSEESVWVKKWSDYMPISKIERVDYVAVGKNEILFGNGKQHLFYNMGTRSWRAFNWEYGHRDRFSRPMAYTESLLPCNGRIDS